MDPFLKMFSSLGIVGPLESSIQGQILPNGNRPEHFLREDLSKSVRFCFSKLDVANKTNNFYN